MSELNAWLIDFARSTTWHWLGMFGFLSFINLVVMYALDSPRSVGGRIARTLGYLAMICGAFAWRWDALGIVAYPLLLLSYLALNCQYWYECRLRKKQIATTVQPEGKVRSVVSAIVRNQDDQPRRAQ